MQSLKLAWDTYEFYNEKAYELEESHQDTIKYYHNFIQKNLNPNQAQKSWLKNKINKSFNKILNIYVKQINSITDLLKIYDYYRLNGITIPAERRLNTQELVNLKNLTATLFEELKVFKKEINEVLR
jgi:hypothetical protein